MTDEETLELFNQVGAQMIEIIKGLPDCPSEEERTRALEWILKAEKILDTITE